MAGFASFTRRAIGSSRSQLRCQALGQRQNGGALIAEAAVAHGEGQPARLAQQPVDAVEQLSMTMPQPTEALGALSAATPLPAASSQILRQIDAIEVCGSPPGSPAGD